MGKARKHRRAAVSAGGSDMGASGLAQAVRPWQEEYAEAKGAAKRRRYMDESVLDLIPGLSDRQRSAGHRLRELSFETGLQVVVISNYSGASRGEPELSDAQQSARDAYYRVKRACMVCWSMLEAMCCGSGGRFRELQTQVDLAQDEEQKAMQRLRKAREVKTAAQYQLAQYKAEGSAALNMLADYFDGRRQPERSKPDAEAP